METGRADKQIAEAVRLYHQALEKLLQIERIKNPSTGMLVETPRLEGELLHTELWVKHKHVGGVKILLDPDGLKITSYQSLRSKP